LLLSCERENKTLTSFSILSPKNISFSLCDFYKFVLQLLQTHFYKKLLLFLLREAILLCFANGATGLCHSEAVKRCFFFLSLDLRIAIGLSGSGGRTIGGLPGSELLLGDNDICAFRERVSAAVNKKSSAKSFQMTTPPTLVIQKAVL